MNVGTYAAVFSSLLLSVASASAENLEKGKEFETGFGIGVNDGETTSTEITIVVISVETESDSTTGAMAEITYTAQNDYLNYYERGDNGYITTDADNPSYGYLVVGMHLVDGDTDQNSEANFGGGIDGIPYVPISGDGNVGGTEGTQSDHPFDPLIDDMLQADLEAHPIMVPVPTNPRTTGDSQSSIEEILDMDRTVIWNRWTSTARELLSYHMRVAVHRQEIFDNRVEDRIDIRRMEEEAYASAVADWIRAIEDWEQECREADEYNMQQQFLSYEGLTPGHRAHPPFPQPNLPAATSQLEEVPVAGEEDAFVFAEEYEWTDVGHEEELFDVEEEYAYVYPEEAQDEWAGSTYEDNFSYDAEECAVVFNAEAEGLASPEYQTDDCAIATF